MALDLEWSSFTWNWSEFCVTGLKPFEIGSNDLLPCFQEIVLQIPTYTIFAAISAYNYGSFSRGITRNHTQLLAISFRVVISILLAALPVLKIFQFYHMDVKIYATDVLVVCTECVMWVVHGGKYYIC